MMNPYTPASNAAGTSVSSPRWLHRFIILNALLVAVPGIVLIAIYSLVALSNQMEMDPATGDPVTHQHFVWIEADPWAAAAYFLLPNVIFAVTFAVWNNGERRSD